MTHAKTPSPSDASFLARNEFLIRRLHSLSGLIPVGAFMIVHLLTNASLMDGAATYQRAVFGIHSLGSILPVVEWVFIFIPILFHGIVGVMIVAGAVPNSGKYPYMKNYRYYAQRATGMIAFLFIVGHVLHLHGGIHLHAWLEYVVKPLNGYQFRAFNASSTLGAAMQGTGAILIWILYLIGVLSCVYHLANGIWTMGITWGVWISPAAQQRASNVCAVFGVLLAIVGVTGIYAAATVDVPQARRIEFETIAAKIDSHEIKSTSLFTIEGEQAEGISDALSEGRWPPELGEQFASYSNVKFHSPGRVQTLQRGEQWLVAQVGDGHDMFSVRREGDQLRVVRIEEAAKIKLPEEPTDSSDESAE